MLHEQIKGSIKEAMLAKDAVLLSTLRSMVSSFTNELVAKNKKPNEMLTDEEVIVVITRLAKQRKDSIEQFKKGNREDLVKEEEAQLAILEKYLPKLMERDEVVKIVTMKKEELGVVDVKDKGKLMATIMKDLKGKADGTLVKEVVDSLF
ncbi:MAG: GatB/YqeY domain-containing protein [bacterium]